MEKEAYAIIHAMNHFRYLLFSAKIIIHTDNKNILFDEATPTSRISRWKFILCEYDIELHHISGDHNTGADTLSRIYSLKESHSEHPYNLQEIQDAQKQDSSSQDLYAQNLLQYKTIDNFQILVDNDNRIYIPKQYENTIISQLHEMLGHCVSSKLYYTVKEYIYIRKMRIRIQSLYHHVHFVNIISIVIHIHTSSRSRILHIILTKQFVLT